MSHVETRTTLIESCCEGPADQRWNQSIQPSALIDPIIGSAAQPGTVCLVVLVPVLLLLLLLVLVPPLGLELEPEPEPAPGILRLLPPV